MRARGRGRGSHPRIRPVPSAQPGDRARTSRPPRAPAALTRQPRSLTCPPPRRAITAGRAGPPPTGSAGGHAHCRATPTGHAPRSLPRRGTESAPAAPGPGRAGCASRARLALVCRRSLAAVCELAPESCCLRAGMAARVLRAQGAARRDESRGRQNLVDGVVPFITKKRIKYNKATLLGFSSVFQVPFHPLRIVGTTDLLRKVVLNEDEAPSDPIY